MTEKRVKYNAECIHQPGDKDSYTPPTTDDLIALRNHLGLTQAQMAELAGLSAGNQWRKYTGGQNPRKMSEHMLFYIAAKLALTENELGKVRSKMKEITG